MIAFAAAHANDFYICEAGQVDQTALRKCTSLLLPTVGTDNQMHARILGFWVFEITHRLGPICVYLGNTRPSVLKGFGQISRQKGSSLFHTSGLQETARCGSP